MKTFLTGKEIRTVKKAIFIISAIVVIVNIAGGETESNKFVKKSDWKGVECKKYSEDDGYTRIQECIFPGANMQQVYNIVKRIDPYLKTELPLANLEYRSTKEEDYGFPEVKYEYKSQKHLFIELGYAGGVTSMEIIENKNNTKSKITFSTD